jgi:hypothetical protein
MTPSAQTGPVPSNGNGNDYERGDVNIRHVVIGGAVLAAIIVASCGGMAWLFGAMARNRAIDTRPASPLAEAVEPTAEIRLQVNPAAELAELRRRERDLLTQYRWVDRSRGIVAIPIDRAIDLLLERDANNEGGGQSDAP